jgi:Major Facilitator Superfamily.
MSSPTVNRQEYILLAISTLTVLSGATIAPSLPYIADNFSQIAHAQFWAQLALCLPGISVALGAAWIGKKTIPSKNEFILLFALISYGIFGCMYILAPSHLILLLASRCALGLSVAAIMILTTILLIKGKPKEQIHRLLGYQAAAGGFGGVIYMALANYLTQWNGLAPFGLYTIAWVLAVFFWVLTPVSYNAKTNMQPTPSFLDQSIPEQSSPSKISLTFTFFAVLAMAEMFTLYALVLQVPLLNLATPYQLSFGLTLALLSMSVTAALYGKIQCFLSYSSQHIAGFIIIAAGFSILGFNQKNLRLLDFYCLLCVIGFGLGLLRPNLVSWLFSTIPLSTRHAVMGKLTSVFFTSQFFAPLLVYPLTHLLGLKALWMAITFVSTSTAVLIALNN